jgi:hypothetical protein
MSDDEHLSSSNVPIRATWRAWPHLVTVQREQKLAKHGVALHRYAFGPFAAEQVGIVHHGAGVAAGALAIPRCRQHS